MPAGRPTKYNKAILEKADEYIDDNDVIMPNAAGMALYLGVSKRSLYQWAEEHEEFSHTLAKLNGKQENLLITKGLTSEFSGTITKLMLANHGYHDKVDQQTEMSVSISNEDAATL